LPFLFQLSAGNPMQVTLGNAAKTLGISKPTLSKAISKGQLSAKRREDGSFAIDTSELNRWWEGVRHRFQPQPVSEFQRATPSENSENPTGTPVNAGNADSLSPDVAARLASLEEQVKGLKDLLEEVRNSRDDWKGQAERLVHALPAPASVPATPETVPTPRRPWWRWLAG
jgi:excisionase family DNA binding protein